MKIILKRHVFSTSIQLGWLVDWVSRRTRPAQWANADGLGFTTNDGPETSHHNFDLPWRGWLHVLSPIVTRGTWDYR